MSQNNSALKIIFDQYNMDLTVVDLPHHSSLRLDTEKDGIEDQSSEIKDTLLGTIINPNSSTDEKTQKPKISFKLSFKSLKDVGSTAIGSVKSLYSRLLIPLNSSLKHYLDVIMELVLAYNVITTLYFLAYAMPGDAMRVIDFICWLFFIFEIVFTFFTETENDKGVITREFLKIAIMYIKSWFFLDVFAIIPLSAGGMPRVEYYFRMVRLLKLPGVLDITDGTGLSYLLTYFKIGKKEKNGKITYSIKIRIIASFIQIFLTLIFFVYFFGCLWFWFQKTVANYKYSSGGYYSDEDEFQDAYELTGLSSEHVALRSSYFMLTTMATIGYGDFLPRNIYEMAFMSCVMLFGVALFAVIMGNFNSAIAYYTDASASADPSGSLISWLDSIEKTKGKMPIFLRKQVIDFYDYYFSKDRLKSLSKNYWDSDNVDDLASISQEYVSDLPDKNYYEILDCLFSDFIYTFQAYLTDEKFKYEIIPYLQPRKFEADQYILNDPDDFDEITFIYTGNFTMGFKFYDNGYNRYFPLLYFEAARTVIGDFSAVTGQPSKFYAHTETVLHTYVINAEVFVKMLNERYKNVWKNIMEIAVGREYNLRRLMNEHLRMTGQQRSKNNDGNGEIKSTFGNPGKTAEVYNEELVDENFKKIVNFHSDLHHKSTAILRNLNGIDMIRMNSILEFNNSINNKK